jgi:hypothetical protein
MLRRILRAASNQASEVYRSSIVCKLIEDPQRRRGYVRKRDMCTEGGLFQLGELMRMLDSFGMQRSRIQKQLHRGMAGSIMQRMFCNDSDANMRLGMFQHGIESSKQQFMAITPRRFGKTTAVAMFVAAFALAVSGSVTAIFSTGRRASNLLLQQIKAMILAIPSAGTRIACSNVETITLDCGGGIFSKISSFPGKART